MISFLVITACLALFFFTALAMKAAFCLLKIICLLFASVTALFAIFMAGVCLLPVLFAGVIVLCTVLPIILCAMLFVFLPLMLVKCLIF